MNGDTRVKVTNRNAGHTGYVIPESNIRRNFTTGESKMIPLEELQQLQYVDGGDYLLQNCFLINDKNALEALNMKDVEPEYFYTEKEVEALLISGSLDQLEDALNFAPAGVIDMIKKMAVDTELPDTRKRKLISEKTGFNVDNAIMINTVMNEEIKDAETPSNARKAKPITVEEQSTPARKAAPVDKYKVVSKQ